ncbi:hypothetical protein, partial [Microbacterium pullorum]|uniref:hypothetical protein n=1 Tax=Microbacterium pullorum TaxID=2762236 RepID=UPI0038508C0E
FQGAVGVLGDGPGGVVFEGVVPFAEVGEVAEVGGPAVGVVDGVVDVADVGGGPAAGEPAVLVAAAEEPALLRGGPVAVGAEEGAGGGVVEQSVPAGRDGRVMAGRGRVEGSVAVEDGGGVTAGEGGGGDGDLDMRDDRIGLADRGVGVGRSRMPVSTSPEF